MNRYLLFAALVGLLPGWCFAADAPPTPTPTPTALSAIPAEFVLQGPRSRQPLLVTGTLGEFAADCTTKTTYASSDATIARVDERGLVTPQADGTAEIVVRHAGREARVQVTVRGMSDPAPIDFRTEVIAALSRAGCNQGMCHGAPQGKNGFRLSLRGYDPDLDLLTLTRELGGRRVHVQTPEESLVLLKGSGRVRHQGSVAFHPGDPAYRTLHAWIAEGARPSPSAAKLVRLEVLPEARRLHTAYPRQQMIVRAHFDGGAVR
ncbi:MAG: Ig-like domain-containing protein, partial [Planctomycetia bacterium]|nr:Ig-like domain-containing protein [Planctomycetia bacterium]